MCRHHTMPWPHGVVGRQPQPCGSGQQDEFNLLFDMQARAWNASCAILLPRPLGANYSTQVHDVTGTYMRFDYLLRRNPELIIDMRSKQTPPLSRGI